ncbi:hypothetical protein [Mesorhizobium sp. IMUNJ 23232]|uniref:hypothetical protein n=1 Tax=Mesorhizobium sp. IMUNJ 23232 TaxID=3376064 RepID=UPI003791021D
MQRKRLALGWYVLLHVPTIRAVPYPPVGILSPFLAIMFTHFKADFLFARWCEIFCIGFDFDTVEAWIPDTLRSLRSLTRSRMTTIMVCLGFEATKPVRNLLRWRTGEPQLKSRMREYDRHKGNDGQRGDGSRRLSYANPLHHGVVPVAAFAGLLGHACSAKIHAGCG